MARKTQPAETGEIRYRNAILAAGFTMYPNPVLAAPELSDGAIRLYGLILLHARQTDRAWPGQKRLAELGAGAPRSQRRHLRELEAAGLITTQQTGLNQSNTYWVEDIPSHFVRDRPKMADPDRPKMADPDRPKMADKEYTDQEYTENNNDIASAPAAPDARPGYDPRFEECWAAYPKRNGKRLGKQDAYKAWLRLAAPDKLILPACIQNYARSSIVRELGAPKDMVRFLRGDYWRDWLTPETARPNGARRGGPAPLDAANYGPGGRWGHVFARPNGDGPNG